MSDRAVPQFNSAGTCPKCGGSDVFACYMPASEDDKYHDYDRRWGNKQWWPKIEFILRRCERCRYEWAEGVLNIAEAQS